MRSIRRESISARTGSSGSIVMICTFACAAMKVAVAIALPMVDRMSISSAFRSAMPAS